MGDDGFWWWNGAKGEARMQQSITKFERHGQQNTNKAKQPPRKQWPTQITALSTSALLFFYFLGNQASKQGFEAGCSDEQGTLFCNTHQSLDLRLLAVLRNIP
jgi:hypothetical protein